jgi:hypothetical protein
MSSLQHEHLVLRDTIEFDETDLSFITTMAAIGDSYSARIGAGGRLGNLGQALQPGSGNSLSLPQDCSAQLIDIPSGRLGLQSLRSRASLSH